MLEIVYTTAFKRDYKKIAKNPKAVRALTDILNLLADEKPLPPKYRLHILSGDYADVLECHILPDLLLLYRVNASALELVVMRIGSHSTLF